VNESRIARALMGLGVTVGLTAAALTVLEVPLNLPDWLVKVAMLKLAFIATAGLLAGGAMLGRHARSRSLEADARLAQLGTGSAEPMHSSRAKEKSAITPH
jgi:hypothetical protein